MTPLCIIPARGGSKRLPHKNRLPLAGRPMIEYSIDCALASGLFERVIVATDQAEIARIAERSGVALYHEPEEMAGDLVGTDQVSLAVLLDREAKGDTHESVVCLQPSSPLRSVSDLAGSWARFVESGADFLVSVTAIDPHYFHWALHHEGGGWKMVFGDTYATVERPLLPPVYRPNGSIKMAKSEALKVTGHFFGSPLDVFETPEDRSVHVATPFDFSLAEHLLARRTE